MQTREIQKTTVSAKQKQPSIKNNHFIQCNVYKNVALFKGDTFVYRGLFRRYGGNYEKAHFGYAVSLTNYEKVKDELKRMVSGFIIVNKEQEEISIALQQPSAAHNKLMLDDESEGDENGKNGVNRLTHFEI